MNCYLVSCFAGFFALDENFDLLDYELFPSAQLKEKWIKSQTKDLTVEEKNLLGNISKKCELINIETNKNHHKYENLKDASKLKLKMPNKGGKYLRANLIELLIKSQFLESPSDLRMFTHQLAIKITEERLKKASEAEDLLLIQAIKAFEEIEESEVKLMERVREWYSLYFPELDQIKDHDKYVELVAQYRNRDSIISSGILATEMDFKHSLGADVNDSDLNIIQEFAKSIQAQQISKKSINNYVDSKMDEIAPNLRDLVGASLGAKIIAHVGDIRRLSLLSSSTVQILGAEKALFRHLKTGENPPKHGLIYQHPEVRGARWWIRGKVARALAAKISLAVRKDVFSGDYDPSIKEGFNQKLEKIKKDHPFPKRTVKSPKKKVKKKKKKDKYRFKKDHYRY
jgi:nucleolar protein 56